MRVTPPLVTTSTSQDVFFGITAAMLTSSSAPETAPAAYSGGTTYGLGATASVGVAGNGHDVYESLAPGNIGHAPASSPTWWKLLGRTYGVYSGVKDYVAGDRAIDDTNHLEYLALTNSTGAALTDTTKWQLTGATNRWRAFDLQRNTATTTPSPLVMTITPGERVDSIGLVGLIASSVTITVTRGATVVYTRTENLSDRATTSWKGYFFGRFSFRTAVALFDLPPYYDAVITITISRSAGDVSCGGIVLGQSIYLGRTLHDAESDALNFSSIDRDFEGNSSLTRRRSVPRTIQQVRSDAVLVKSLYKARIDLNAVPCLWSGLDDIEHAYFEPLLILGVYKQFTIRFDKAAHALTTLELEEV